MRKVLIIGALVSAFGIGAVLGVGLIAGRVLYLIGKAHENFAVDLSDVELNHEPDEGEQQWSEFLKGGGLT